MRAVLSIVDLSLLLGAIKIKSNILSANLSVDPHCFFCIAQSEGCNTVLPLVRLTLEP
jgi:hypothetical protein